METKHTPGPWIYEERCSGIVITKDRKDEDVMVAHILINEEDDLTDEQEANARLIVAAPELLEACKEAYSVLSGWGFHKAIQAQLQSIIAKAEGGSNA